MRAAAARRGGEHWQAMLFEGHQVGHAVTTQARDSSGDVVHAETIVLDLPFGGVRERIEIETTYRERPDGTPVQLRRTRRIGGERTLAEADVHADRVELRRRRGAVDRR